MSRRVGSNHALGTIFPIFHHLHDSSDDSSKDMAEDDRGDDDATDKYNDSNDNNSNNNKQLLKVAMNLSSLHILAVGIDTQIDPLG